MLLSFLFYFLLSLLFLSESFSINGFPKLSLYITLIFTLVIFLKQIINNKKIFFPKSSLFFIIFLVFSSISVFFAIDKQVAFETDLTYIVAFLIFVLSFNNRDKLKSSLPIVIIYLSVISIIIFVLGKLFNFNYITEGSSLFNSVLNHGQWSNYLVLGCLASLSYFLEKKKSIFIFLFIIFLSFLLLNYSRTGYLALFIGVLMLIMHYKKVKSTFKVIIISFSLFSLLLFFLISNKDINLPKQLSLFRNYLITRMNLPQEKELLGKRNIYFLYGLSSMVEKPFFGVGPGNFYFAASKRQLYYNENTTTAHNIIIDILVENGQIAGLFFILFFIYTIIKAKRNINFYLLLSLTAIFLFDFSYRFDSFLLLWFILLGLVDQENESITLYPKFLLLAFLIFQIIFFMQILLLQNQPDPENNFFAASKKARYYYALGEREKAIYYYEKNINLYPFSIVLNKNVLNRVLSINISLYGRDIGRKKTVIFMNDKLINIQKGSPIVDRINKFCNINNFKCYNN